MAISLRLQRLGSGVFERNDKRKEIYRSNLKNKPQPLVDLSLGSTDLAPPEVVLDVIESSLRRAESSSYSLHSSTKPFREAVSEWCEFRLGVDVDPDREVLFLVGSQEGTAHLPLAVMNSGETGLVLDPSYPSHLGGMVLADAHVERLVLNPSNNWRPDFQSLTNSQLEQLRMMIFGFPHNPTAQVGKQCWLDEAMELGLRNDFVVAHDNPYVDLALEGEAPVLLRSPGWRESGIEFFSFSKGWCLGGFRLGFAVGAASLIKALKELKGVVDFNQSLALQHGAIAALKTSPDWSMMNLDIYRDRRDRVLAVFKKHGWEFLPPSMALYLWLPLPERAKQQGIDDESFASALLEKTGVALTPGSGFGSAGSGWLRLALVRPACELEVATGRVANWFNEFR